MSYTKTNTLRKHRVRNTAKADKARRDVNDYLDRMADYRLSSSKGLVRRPVDQLQVEADKGYIL